MNIDKQMLSISEVAELVGIPAYTIRRMISEDKLKAHKSGNKFYISRKTLNETFDITTSSTATTAPVQTATEYYTLSVNRNTTELYHITVAAKKSEIPVTTLEKLVKAGMTNIEIDGEIYIDERTLVNITPC